MKLKDYVLNEKVSKSERRSVLTDPKVKIGVEIEFKIPRNRNAGREEIVEKFKTKLGIKDIKEFGYHGGTSYSGWRLETDPTAGEELISPPLPAPLFVKLIPKVFSYLRIVFLSCMSRSTFHPICWPTIKAPIAVSNVWTLPL